MSAPSEATAREIARAAKLDRRTVDRRAAREGWPYREVPHAGHSSRLYLVESLPIDIRRALAPPRTEEARAPGMTLPASSVQPPFSPPSTAVETEDPSPCHHADAHALKMGTREGQAGTVADGPASSLPTPGEDPLEIRWDRLPESRRARAEAKLAALDRAVAIAFEEGLRMREACELAAASDDSRWSAATLLAAFRAVRDLPRNRQAMALADRWEGRGRFADCDPEAWEAFKADYLCLERPTLASCHRRLLRIAEPKGWAAPASARSLKRRLENEVPWEVIVLAREGVAALNRMIPPQKRLRPDFALDAVNCDGHKFDTWVDWHGDGRDPIRPVGVFWQDLASGKPLAYRLAETENAASYGLSFHDLLRDYGIPGAVYCDNGRGIAAKWLTGGATHRYKFKIKPGDPVGLLTQLVGKDNIHWTKPYSGQSKPIERLFRGFAEDFARGPRLRGAWTGSGPGSKPENYRSRAVPRKAFEEAVAEFIRSCCAQRGRRGLGMEGRSFDEKFAAVWDPARVARPTEGQLSRWLLAAEAVTADSRSGAVTLLGTQYYAPEMARELALRPKAERRVVVRFDPENLALPVTVEHLDGRLIARAKPRGAVAFGSREGAEERAREERRFQRTTREALKIQKRMADAELVRLLEEAPVPEPAPLPPAKVVAGAFGHPAPPAEADEREYDEMIARADEDVLAAVGMGGGVT